MRSPPGWIPPSTRGYSRCIHSYPVSTVPTNFKLAGLFFTILRKRPTIGFRSTASTVPSNYDQRRAFSLGRKKGKPFQQVATEWNCFDSDPSPKWKEEEAARTVLCGP